MRLGFALALSLSVGCTAQNFCKERMACEGGNDADYAACVAYFDADSKVAEAYGCDAEWAEASTCLVEESECNDGYFDSDCDFEAYFSCIEGASEVYR